MQERISPQRRVHWKRPLAAITAALLALSGATLAASAAQAQPVAGGEVWIGAKQGYGGTGIWPVYSEQPADPDNPGEPDFWTYCLEQRVTAQEGIVGHVGDAGSFLGDNYFTDPDARGKALWVLGHSFPAIGLDEFAASAGLTSISANDAIEATQYAIWRYTDLNFDASWSWETPDSEAAYWYLVNGANASGGLNQGDFETTVSITPPPSGQTADSLVGPFTVTTNQPTAQLTVDPALTLTDAAGDPVNPDTVVDGQQLYLDLRGDQTAGTGTVTAAVNGSSATGLVVSSPLTPGDTPTESAHSQSRIIVAPSGTATSDSAAAAWGPTAADPVIGTSLVDAADGDQVLHWTGGTVIDTVFYENLTPGVEYTVTGELMRKPNGTGTGITGSTTFTPTQADGEVDVTFVVPEGYAGEALVAFEWLFVGATAGDRGDAIAAHTDIDDPAQTITVESAPVPTVTDENEPDQKAVQAAGPGQLANTGSESPAFALTLALTLAAVLAALAGLSLLMSARREAR